MWAAEGWPRGSLLPQGHCPCGDAPPIVVVAKSAQLRFPRRHKLRIPRSGHANQNSLTSLLRLSPPRRRGGDPNAKTAPAPLHPKSTSAPTPWAWALRLSPPRGARRGPHLEASRRKCAAPGGKGKMFGGSVCAGADLLPPAGDGWRSRAAVRDGNALTLGKPSARGSLGYIPLLFSLPLTVPRGSWCNGRMRASAPTECGRPAIIS